MTYKHIQIATKEEIEHVCRIDLFDDNGVVASKMISCEAVSCF